MVRILALGNSFSEDATYFLHQILEAADVENKVVNLYIGGCPIERHWQNIEGNCRDYQYQLNGRKTDRYVSIEEILMEEKWDYIVTHQASHDSGWVNTYEPFLGLLANYLKEKAPQAKIFFNQTWAYEPDSTHGNFMRYNRNQAEMYEKLTTAYKTMAVKYELPLIPSGELIQKLRATKYFEYGKAKRSICRDGFHLSFLYGRYAVACLWAKKMFDISAMENDFVPAVNFMPYEEANTEIINIIKEMVDSDVTL